jgi:DNA-binding transcriptional MocR family regulator
MRAPPARGGEGLTARPAGSGATAVERITSALRAEIARGGRPDGALPSVRELVARHHASPVTVARAIAGLSREGLLIARPGRGTFVAPRPREPAPEDLSWQSVALDARPRTSDALEEHLMPAASGELNLAAGYIDETLQPTALLAAALTRAARRPGIWGRMPADGLEPLRRWFATEIGSNLSTHDVLIVPGAQTALMTAFRALGVPGSPVLFESPTYLGALAAAQACGLRPVPVPTDEHGVRPDLLESAFKTSGARLFYCQPTFANPTGAVLAPARHATVLDLAARAGAFIVEDDFARDLSLDGRAAPPLVSAGSGHVVYIRSLTKSAAAGLRIGALCSRGAISNRLRAARIVEDLFVSGPLQEAALELVTAPAWRRHLRELRAGLRQRRDAVCAALRAHVPELAVPAVPSGGYSLWIRLPPGSDDAELARRALGVSVRVTPGRVWFPAEPPGPFLRISYAGAPLAVLEEGVRRLACVVRGTPAYER